MLMSWPVHRAWFPDFGKLQRIIDIRVRWDLVIMADRGGQKFRAPSAHASKVEAHVRSAAEDVASRKEINHAFTKAHKISQAV